MPWKVVLGLGKLVLFFVINCNKVIDYQKLIETVSGALIEFELSLVERRKDNEGF